MNHTIKHFISRQNISNLPSRILPRLAFCLLAASMSTVTLFGQLTFTNQNIPSGTYEAATSIIADSGNGTTTVSSGASVTFRSGGTITLLPNFHAVQGSLFHAVIASSGSFTISGRVTSPSGCGIAGVTMNLTGGQTAKTDATGAYAFTVGLGTYTVQPSQSAWAFDHSSLSVNNSSPTANFQVTSPAIPSREYVRLGGRIVAVATCGAQ